MVHCLAGSAPGKSLYNFASWECLDLPNLMINKIWQVSARSRSLTWPLVAQWCLLFILPLKA